MKGLDLAIDRDAQSPLYRQIGDQIRRRIRDGAIRPGDRLPTVRALADAMGVTRLTVHRAFRALKAEGWIEATVGRGSFARAAPEVPRVVPEVAPEGAPVGRALTPDDIMADIGLHGAREGIRNLAHAEPDPALMPAAAFWDCFAALRDDAAAHAQYIPSQGDPLLREACAALLHARGVEAGPDEVIVTSGVTQGLSLVAQALARPGDTVAVEQPTYLGLLHILKAQGLRAVGVPMDGEGPRLDALERCVAHDRPRFFYTIPSFHNPTGRNMTSRRRRDLMALASRHALHIIEDDIYHRLAYDAPAPPTLRSLDARGLVVYLDGMSKAALPGVRAGFVVAPRPLMDRLVSLRRASDLCGPAALQRALAVFFLEGHVDRQMKRILPRYRGRRDAAMKALAAQMPEGVTWSRPEGGFCTWVTLPGATALADLYRAALDRGVIIAPGEVFMVDPGPRRHLRICFGREAEKVVGEGIAILGELIAQRLRTPEPPRAALPDHATLV